MFDRLPIEKTTKILEKLDHKTAHRVRRVSHQFKTIIDHPNYWKKKLNKKALKLQKYYNDLPLLEAELTAAALLGLTHYVQYYIDKKADINVKLYLSKNNNVYLNPVHYAALSGNLACVKILVDNQAIFMPEVPKEFFNSPLHFAAASGSLPCTKFFLDAGVPVDQASQGSPLGWNWTPLQVAAAHNKIECYKILRERGADIHYQDSDQYQAIHRASYRGSLEVLKLLLEDGADPNACNEDCITPLIMACDKNHENIVLELLKNGADPRLAVSIFCHSLLLRVFERKQYQLAKILLDWDRTLCEESLNYCSPDEAENERETLLHQLAKEGDIKGITLLLLYQPNPHFLFEGQLAFEIALENGHLECANLIYDYALQKDFDDSSLEMPSLAM